MSTFNKMNKLILVIALIVPFNITWAQEFKTDYKEDVLTFINCIKNHNKAKLTSLTTFPFRRNYPLPDIKNEDEFIKRYYEIFDDSLINMIVNSDLKNNWTAVGWRGIMLNHGVIWLDSHGRLIAVNYQSNSERIKREKLIENDKNSIHESLKNFAQPKLLLETEKFRIRIDELSNEVYRYASWYINSTMNEKPDLVIESGSWMPEGNGGNNKYEFVNGDYKYECSINVVGTDETPAADLTVYKDEKEILYQAAKIIRN